MSRLDEIKAQFAAGYTYTGLARRGRHDVDPQAVMETDAEWLLDEVDRLMEESNGLRFAIGLHREEIVGEPFANPTAADEDLWAVLDEGDGDA